MWLLKITTYPIIKTVYACIYVAAFVSLVGESLMNKFRPKRKIQVPTVYLPKSIKKDERYSDDFPESFVIEYPKINKNKGVKNGN